MLFAGPLLSTLAVTQSISIPYVPLNGPHAIRLIANLLALAILWILAFAASRQISDNGRGSSFFRSLVLPLTTLIVILFAQQSIHDRGPSTHRTSWARLYSQRDMRSVSSELAFG